MHHPDGSPARHHGRDVSCPCGRLVGMTKIGRCLSPSAGMTKSAPGIEDQVGGAEGPVGPVKVSRGQDGRARPPGRPISAQARSGSRPRPSSERLAVLEPGGRHRASASRAASGLLTTCGDVVGPLVCLCVGHQGGTARPGRADGIPDNAPGGSRRRRGYRSVRPCGPEARAAGSRRPGCVKAQPRGRRSPRPGHRGGRGSSMPAPFGPMSPVT